MQQEQELSHIPTIIPQVIHSMVAKRERDAYHPHVRVKKSNRMRKTYNCTWQQKNDFYVCILLVLYDYLVCCFYLFLSLIAICCCYLDLRHEYHHHSSTEVLFLTSSLLRQSCRTDIVGFPRDLYNPSSFDNDQFL